ncbi:hypothetical protein [Anaerotignum sp.]|uniref:hypothetical protein n=1 Tax=Anaerotignum sp. TaxID=2039241 RepID=UPI0028A96139|nr:hypothetical protein [Anaerotignum sp.]
MKCGCEDLIVCTDCGQTVSAANARYSDGSYYCNACLHICAACQHTVHTDMYPAFNRQGRMVEICADCYQAMVETCSDCSVRPICTMLGGARFCQRTAVTAAIA